MVLVPFPFSLSLYIKCKNGPNSLTSGLNPICRTWPVQDLNQNKNSQNCVTQFVVGSLYGLKDSLLCLLDVTNCDLSQD